MKYLQHVIYKTIAGNPEIVKKLAHNQHWSGKEGESQKNSVIFSLEYTNRLKPPFVTFSFGTVPALGKSRVAQLFIRIYDVKVGNTVKLIELKELVREALNDKILKTTVNKQVYEYHFVPTLEQPVMEDEALSLNFAELEFNVLVV